MNKCIYFNITNKYLYCKLINYKDDSSVCVQELRSDNPEIQEKLSPKVQCKKNSLEASKIMAQLLSSTLDKHTEYGFRYLTGKYRYHGKIKAFIEELKAKSITIKPLKA